MIEDIIKYNPFIFPEDHYLYGSSDRKPTDEDWKRADEVTKILDKIISKEITIFEGEKLLRKISRGESKKNDDNRG